MIKVKYRVIRDNRDGDYMVHHDTSLTYWGSPQEFSVSELKFRYRHYPWSNLLSTWEGYLKSRRFEVVEFGTEQEVLDYLADLAFTEELLK